MSPNTGTPPSDTAVFSGIRWSVNLIENLAIQAYWNDRANWPAIVACLQQAVECLTPNADKAPQGDDCPWTVCEDGSCRPICPIKDE